MNDNLYIELNKLFQQEEFIKIIKYCDLGIKKNENNYLLWGAKGRASFELKQYDDAIHFLSKAIELFPNYHAGFYNRGLSYYWKDEFHLAINDFKMVKSFIPDYEDVDFYLGYSYSLIEDFENGIKAFSNFLLKYEDKSALEFRFDLYNRTHQYAQASKDLTSLLLLELSKIEEFERLNSPHQDLLIASRNNKIGFKPKEMGFDNLKNRSGSGVYILEFTNGEFYVGQTENIKNRIKQHFRRFDDIEQIYFKPTNTENLLKEETNTIHILERKHLRIRNLKQIDFLNIFDSHAQKQWVQNTKFNFLSGEKFNNEKIRKDFSERFLLFKEKKYFKNLTKILSCYVKSAIPNYIASEYNYWSITCLPKYLKGSNCISRININAVPVLSIFEKNEDLTLMFYSSKLPFLKYLKENGKESFLNQINTAHWDLRNAFKEKTQDDEITFFVRANDFFEVIGNPLYLSSIRLFNLRMMNNTGREKGYRRRVSHCLDLSDYLIDLAPKEL